MFQETIQQTEIPMSSLLTFLYVPQQYFLCLKNPSFLSYRCHLILQLLLLLLSFPENFLSPSCFSSPFPPVSLPKP